MNLTKSRFRIIRLNTYILIIFALLVIAFKAGTFESLFGPDNLTDKVYAAKSQSDLDGDGDVDIDDLAIFSSKWLKADYQTIDWCQWLTEEDKSKKHLDDELRDFIATWFKCRVKNPNNYPTRLAYGPDGKLFVSDAKIGSVFIYDAGLNIIDEIGGIDKPLGIALNNAGNIYVGSDGDDTVKVFNPQGEYIKSIGSIGMPNDMVFDRSGNLYVADSVNNKIKIYDAQGQNIRNIAADVPVSLAISSYLDSSGQEVGELFVAEMRLAQISVFDLQGNFLCSFGRKVSTFGSYWHGRFVKLQSLAIDTQGRVHALDCYLNKVQILDAQSGTFLASYPPGDQPEHTNLFLDIVIKDPSTAVLTNSESKRLEIFQY